MKTLKEIFRLLKEAYQEWSDDKASRIAAAMAYYTVFSIGPLLLIVISIAGLAFGQEAVQGRVQEEIDHVIGGDAAEMVQTMIAGANKQSSGIISTIVGVVSLLLAGAGVFGHLQEALNTAWDVEPKKKSGNGIINMIKDKFFSFTMVLGIAFMLLVSLVISAAIAGLDYLMSDLVPAAQIVMQIVNQIVSFAIVTLLFAAMYRVVPDKDIEWREVWVGAAFTAFLFTVGKFALGWYLGRSSFGSTYGAAGAFVLILVWVYYNAQILLFGAEFTQVYAKEVVNKPEEIPNWREYGTAAGEGIAEVTHVVTLPPAVENRRSLANMLTSMVVLIAGFVAATVLGKTGMAK